MIKLPDYYNFDNLCRGTYTTSNGTNTKVSIAALIEVMKQIPEPPKIFSMDFRLFANNLLPKNTIIMSKDIAEALEEAMIKEKYIDMNMEEVRYKAAKRSYIPKGWEVVMEKGRCTLRRKKEGLEK